MATGYQGYQGYDPERAKLDRSRRLAEMLQEGALDTGPKSFWEGAAQLGKAFIARGAMDRADKAEAAYGDAQKRALDFFVGQTYDDPAAVAAPLSLTPGNVAETAASVKQGGENNRDARIVRAAMATGMPVMDAMNMVDTRRRRQVEDQRYTDDKLYARGRDAEGDRKWQATFDQSGNQFDATMGFNRDQFGETRRHNMATEGIDRLKAQTEASTTGIPDFGDENTFRNQYLGQAKTFQEVRDAYKRIQAVGSATTPAEQMSLIFGYMKMLDPGSTVREGEYATAQNTTGIPGWILNSYNKAKDGTFLDETQVKNFLSQAGAQYKAAEDTYAKTYDFYRSQAPRYGMSPDIIQDLRPPKLPPKPNLMDSFVQGAGNLAQGFTGMFGGGRQGARPQQTTPRPVEEYTTEELVRMLAEAEGR